MDKLESEKKKLNPNPDEGKAIVEIFALKMFKKADDGDRAGNYTASIAKLYYAASILMQATKQFGEISEDIDEKLQYAKWRAAEISKSIKTGQPPPPPPGSEETQHEDDFNPISQQEHVDEAFSKQIFEKKQSSFNDPFFSQQQQQPTKHTKEEDDFFSSVQPNQQPNNDFFDIKPQNQQDSFNDDFFNTKVTNDPPKLPQKKEIEPKNDFNDDFFSSVQPNNTQTNSDFNDDFFKASQSNQPQHFEPKQPQNQPPKLPPPTNKPNPAQQDPQTHQKPIIHNNQSNQPKIQKPQAVLQPITQQTEFVLKRHNVPNDNVSMDDIMKAQKYAKFVVSSLQFPDVPTAVKYLEDALALLVKKE